MGKTPKSKKSARRTRSSPRKCATKSSPPRTRQSRARDPTPQPSTSTSSNSLAQSPTYGAEQSTSCHRGTWSLGSLGARQDSESTVVASSRAGTESSEVFEESATPEGSMSAPVKLSPSKRPLQRQRAELIPLFGDNEDPDIVLRLVENGAPVANENESGELAKLPASTSLAQYDSLLHIGQSFGAPTHSVYLGGNLRVLEPGIGEGGAACDDRNEPAVDYSQHWAFHLEPGTRGLLGITESSMREDILAGRPYPILQDFKLPVPLSRFPSLGSIHWMSRQNSLSNQLEDVPLPEVLRAQTPDYASITTPRILSRVSSFYEELANATNNNSQPLDPKVALELIDAINELQHQIV